MEWTALDIMVFVVWALFPVFWIIGIVFLIKFATEHLSLAWKLKRIEILIELLKEDDRVAILQAYTPDQIQHAKGIMEIPGAVDYLGSYSRRETWKAVLLFVFLVVLGSLLFLNL